MARLIDKLYGNHQAEQTIVSHFNKGQQVKQGPDVQEVLEKLNENFSKGIINDEIYEGACNELDQLVKARTTKYIRREGVKGNYRYIYKEGQGPKGNKEDDFWENKGSKGEEKNTSAYRKHLMQSSDKELAEYAKNASFSAIKKRMMSDKNWQEGNKESDSSHKVGDNVKIPRNLTSDPYNRQGQTGKIIKVDEKNDEVIVEFENGGSGRYQLDAVEKVKKEVEGKKDQINPAKQSKKELYEAVNKKYGTSFKPGDIEEFEDESFRKELTEDDIKSIVDDEKGKSKKEEYTKHPYNNNTKTEYNDVVRVMNALGRSKPIFIDPVKNNTAFRIKINQEDKDKIFAIAKKAVPSVELVEGRNVNKGTFHLYIPKNTTDKELINYDKYK